MNLFGRKLKVLTLFVLFSGVFNIVDVSADTTMPVLEGQMSCDRACMIDFIDQYIAAMVAHDPHSLPTSKDVIFTENSVRLNLGDGLWDSVVGFTDYRFYMADPYSGNAAFIGVVLEGDGPKVLALRLRIKNMKIKEVQTVIARTGSSDPLPDDLDEWTLKPIWLQEVPAEQRVSRSEAVMAANMYFEAIEQDSKGLVPWADGCNGMSREFNGNQAEPDSPFTQQDCDSMFGNGVMGGLEVPERQYWLVDEEMGIVIGAFIFSSDKPFVSSDGSDIAMGGVIQSQPNSGVLVEAFKIIDGKVYEVNAVTGYSYQYGTRTGW